MTLDRPISDSAADLKALCILAQNEHRAGRLAEATAAYRRIVALRPDVAEMHNNLGIALAQQGQVEEALACFGRAVALRPDFVDAGNNLGTALRQQGRLAQATAQYERVIALRPDYADAHANLGAILGEQGEFERAVASFERALALRPDSPDALNNLGHLLLQHEQLDAARVRLERAIALRPDYHEAHHNLGIALWRSNRLDEAIARFQQAMALWPAEVLAYNNRAARLGEQGDLAAAGEIFQRLEALQPHAPFALLGLAICYLTTGDYRRGWPAHEARLHLPGAGAMPDLPRWTGQGLAGKSLLLVAEQGLGDTLQFVRYARLLKARGARVALECQQALGPLLARYPHLDELIFSDSPAAPRRFDFYLPLLSAPAALKTEAATIPSEHSYLSASPELVEQWRARLAGIEGFKIGIAWQGSPKYQMDRWRSIPLGDFAPLARLPGVQLVSLQTGQGARQIASVDFPVLDLSDRLDETTGAFMDTAAVIRNLDLVIAPDTATAHLAGALGAPVWVALQLVPDWRWLLDRDDSPWYPTARLFRQQAVGQWPEVFQRMAQAVEQHRSSASHREGQP